MINKNIGLTIDLMAVLSILALGPVTQAGIPNPGVQFVPNEAIASIKLRGLIKSPGDQQ
jgi:hypothetical protein